MKKNNISFISAGRSDLLYDILSDLDKNKYGLFEFADKKEKPVFQKAGNKCPIRLESFLSGYLSLIFYPLIFLICLAKLATIKMKRSIGLIIISSYPEKIFLSLAAKLLKIKVLWAENPGEVRRLKNRPLFFLYRLFSRNTDIIAFTSDDASLLAGIKIKKENIKTFLPGIRIKDSLRQEKIFSRLADTDENKFKKFFTVGTALDLDSKQKIELLFASVKKCSSVIPQIQLIVIGDGLERKNLSWIAKKMGIDGLVWFVGEQAFFRKWADSFDIYALASDKLAAGDIKYALQAMAAGLPIISAPLPALDEFVRHLNNGLITEKEDSEALAQAIIRLQQNRGLCKKLGKEGKSLVDNVYTLDKMTRQFENMIKNN